MSYHLINTSQGEECATILSTHKTLAAAREAFKEANPHLCDPDWAQRHGYANTGTFDRIEDDQGNGYDWQPEEDA